jgi:host factor-I protein
MTKTPFNIQDQFLNQSRKERVRLSVRMISGEVVEGLIKSFDNFSILLEVQGDILIYKHAIASISSCDGQFKLHQ